MEDQKTVLLVEDKKSLLKVIEKKLSEKGLEVIKARKAKSALKKIKNNEIDVIWLDHYLLGDKNGLKLVTDLKDESSEFNDIPIFVVSNTAGANKVQSYLRLGVDKYYTKAKNDLNEIVTELINYLENE